VLATQEFLAVVEECRSFKAEMKEDFNAYGFINRRNLRKSNERAEITIKKDGLKMFTLSLSAVPYCKHGCVQGRPVFVSSTSLQLP